MKCQSCQEEISERFSHAFASNCCPFCGGEIVPKDLQNIFITLKDVFTDGSKYMEQIEQWLFTNYSLKKVSAPSPGQMQRSASTDEILNGNFKQPELTPFMKKVNIKHNPKDLIAKIQGSSMAGAAPPEAFVDENGNIEDFKQEQQYQQEYPPNEMEELFVDPRKPNSLREFEEKEKLKKLRAQNALMGGGLIRRG